MVLWSTASVQSRWVLGEAETAVERAVLVPILIEEVEIPLQFKAIHASNFAIRNRASRKVEINKALEAIAGYVRDGSTPDPIPPDRLRFALVGIAISVLAVGAWASTRTNTTEVSLDIQVTGMTFFFHGFLPVPR